MLLLILLYLCGLWESDESERGEVRTSGDEYHLAGERGNVIVRVEIYETTLVEHVSGRIIEKQLSK